MGNALSDFAPDDDEQNDDQPPAAKPGALADGEHLCVEVAAEPETFDHDQYGDGIRIPANFVEADHDGNFKGEGPFEPGERVTVVFWSKRLARAMARIQAETDGSLVGETITIYAHQPDPDRATSREYSVDLGEPAEE